MENEIHEANLKSNSSTDQELIPPDMKYFNVQELASSAVFQYFKLVKENVEQYYTVADGSDLCVDSARLDGSGNGNGPNDGGCDGSDGSDCCEGIDWDDDEILEEMSEIHSRYLVAVDPYTESELTKEVKDTGFLLFQFSTDLCYPAIKAAIQSEKQRSITDSADATSNNAATFTAGPTTRTGSGVESKVFPETSDADADGISENVIYCYQLQIFKEYQRNGIGRKMMDCLEQIAVKYHFAVMKLTVFKANTNAMQFYAKLGFVLDSSDPSFHSKSPASYSILSKYL